MRMMVTVEMGNKTHSQKIDDAAAVVKSKNHAQSAIFNPYLEGEGTQQ
jgi:hypothetical protein